MFFVVLVLMIAIGASLVRGGRFHRIGRAPLRTTWLLFVGVALQVAADAGVVLGWFEGTGTISYGLLLASQVVVVAWVLRNAYLPGLALVAIGLALNAAVMGANGAMPVHPEAIAALGQDPGELVRGKHVLLDDDTRWWWLADIWPVPPIRSIISIGDVVLAAGLLPITHHLMTFRTPAERRGTGTVPDDSADDAETAPPSPLEDPQDGAGVSEPRRADDAAPGSMH
ncbi:MAG: DUF5317 domain-containing protein [Intrasporangiaceae bacterium]|nr:DUF5317 domain-containing protein [Intrasporangiaceae bacterium]